MKRIDIISAVPTSMESYINSSILKKAQDKNLIEIHINNLHNFTNNPKDRIDDYVYGGSAGMLIKCEPLFNCIIQLKSERVYDEVIFLTADGDKLSQSISNELSLKNNIILIAGHYKGIDYRIRENLVTREISIGDFVLTGGELPALVLCDSIVRLIPGVINDMESALDDSFMNGLLEAPQYTRPEIFNGWKVPEVLLGGNHKLIKEWIDEQSYNKTKTKRPDLLNS